MRLRAEGPIHTGGKAVWRGFAPLLICSPTGHPSEMYKLQAARVSAWWSKSKWPERRRRGTAETRNAGKQGQFITVVLELADQSRMSAVNSLGTTIRVDLISDSIGTF